MIPPTVSPFPSKSEIPLRLNQDLNLPLATFLIRTGVPVVSVPRLIVSISERLRM
jgi:hypothetical protein